MKFSIALCSSLVVSVLAAPAVVWKKNNRANTESRVLHSSDEWQASDLLGEALDRASLSVVFLVGKASDGTESLTELASSGMLPLVAEKYNDATGIYHHVSGLESTQVMVKAAGSVLAEGQKVLQISMAELNAKLAVATAPEEIEVNEAGATITATSTSTKWARSAKREKALAGANVLMVTVDPKADAAMIDQTISLTIENETVESVVLAGIRSLAEVKRERGLASSRKQSIMQTQGTKVMEARRQRRRRLDQEEEEEGDQGDDANNNDDMTGVYYVHMTPNILAGLLFLGLFTVITWIGISCLGDITGQEVFVTKMPSIGREA